MRNLQNLRPLILQAEIMKENPFHPKTCNTWIIFIQISCLVKPVLPNKRGDSSFMSNFLWKPPQNTHERRNPLSCMFYTRGYFFYYQLLATIDTSVIARKFPPNWTGRPMYNRSAIFKALVLKEILQIPTIENLIIVLAHSEFFSCWCGFDITRRLPSATVFYRFYFRHLFRPG